jgi:hypothetical protein
VAGDLTNGPEGDVSELDGVVAERFEIAADEVRAP